MNYKRMKMRIWEVIFNVNKLPYQSLLGGDAILNVLEELGAVCALSVIAHIAHTLVKQLYPCLAVQFGGSLLRVTSVLQACAEPKGCADHVSALKGKPWEPRSGKTGLNACA
ncbi:hypothetical protein DPMN_026123 [Dreissena polymorpha]|uniref:Uncharacterized protein n=1 Tax=Dreissena polymorpha TaxID=45954 RepID=A0A9D4RE95_DREPO|nr:hypothetical protein DPMN_026123 [Dreissena polymorpha]